jgi:hypothetical protein
MRVCRGGACPRPTYYLFFRWAGASPAPTLDVYKILIINVLYIKKNKTDGYAAIPLAKMP